MEDYYIYNVIFSLLLTTLSIVGINISSLILLGMTLEIAIPSAPGPVWHEIDNDNGMIYTFLIPNSSFISWANNKASLLSNPEYATSKWNSALESSAK